MDKQNKKFKINYVKTSYGGNEYHLSFTTPPTHEELYQAVRSIDSCPFGFRMVSGKPGESTLIVVKVYND
jgi:hypothetical protein